MPRWPDKYGGQVGDMWQRCGVVFIIFFRVLFICDANFNYFLDKCGVLNEILEPAIFIFNINTNEICNTRLRRIKEI